MKLPSAALIAALVCANDKYSVKCNDFMCSDFSLVRSESAEQLVKRQVATPTSQTATSTDGMVSFDVTCSGDNCDALASSLVTVGNYMTEAITLVKPLKVSFSFVNFCAGQGEQLKDIACQSLLGLAYPSSYFGVTPNTGYVYPQALMKQFNNQPANFDQYDIISQFNSEISWYFPSDGGQISRDQYDITLVALHEMTHGLGMASLWTAVGQQLTPRGQPSQLFTVYDNYLQSANLGFWNQYAVDVYQWLSSGSGGGQQEASNLYQAATTPLSTSFNGGLKVYTPTQYVNGSSLTHVDQNAYANTAEFLMRPKLSSGRTVADLKGDRPSPYGPQMLKLLQKMGYQVSFQLASFSDASQLEISMLPLMVLLLLWL